MGSLIGGRRKWRIGLPGCESVERECEELRRALGGNNRAPLVNAEEVHHVEVLPERHGRLVLQRDKLRQVYEVKVHRLSTVINPLSTSANPS